MDATLARWVAFRSATTAHAMAVSRADAEALYRRHAPAVYRRALGLLRDEQEAADVTQETFIAWLKGADRLRGEAQPFTVLYQMATYQAVDRLRKKARWHAVVRPQEVPADGEGEFELPDPAAPGDDAARVDAAQDLALLTQGEDQQTLTAASLYYVEGCTTEEVAEVLDVSRKTVGRLLAQFATRAKKRAERLAPGAFP
jgi:RNA polymerase sigma factor (sigma-70 family)